MEMKMQQVPISGGRKVMCTAKYELQNGTLGWDAVAISPDRLLHPIKGTLITNVTRENAEAAIEAAISVCLEKLDPELLAKLAMRSEGH